MERGQLQDDGCDVRGRLKVPGGFDGKVALIVGVTKDLTARIQAGKIIAEVAKKVGGSGGGRPDMAQAGGTDPSKLDEALAHFYAIVEAPAA